MRKIRNPIIDPRTNIFRHGKHAGSTISEVFMEDPGYLEFLSYEAKGLHPIVRGHIRREYMRLSNKLSSMDKYLDSRDKKNMAHGRSASGKRRKY